MTESLRLALFGHPVSHSRSAALFEAYARERGLSVDYELVDVPPGGLPEALARLRAGVWDGANVTIPHKREAAALVDELGDDARAAGAVNVLVRQPGGTLRGENTDGAGFLACLPQRVERALVLGGGGAARGVGAALVREGAAVVVVSRTPETKADWQPQRAHAAIGWEHPRLVEITAASDLVVQATPLGMEPYDTALPPLPLDVLGPRHVVVDLVYRPWETELLRQVRARGCVAQNGWAMLVEQAAAALVQWRGAGADEGFREAAATLEPRPG